MNTTQFSPENLLESAAFEVNNPVILCVDDEQFILDSLYNVLETKFGDKYQYEFAESAEEALNVVETLKKENATLVMVITDRVMPGMSGDELLEVLHKSHPSAIKILLTGQVSTESAINAINNVDLFRYLTKPWDANGFLKTVESGLDQYFTEHSTQQKMHIFKKLVPDELLNTLDKNAMPDLAFDEVNAREMTLLHTDARCLAPFITGLKRADADTMVRHFIDAATLVIKDHNGYIDQHIGTPITGLFPERRNAIRAAYQLKSTLQHFIHQNRLSGFALHISLYTGYLMLEPNRKTQVQGITKKTIQLSSTINQLCAHYGVDHIICKGSIAKNTKARSNARWVATIRATSLDTPLKLYELLDKNNPIDKRKLNTKISFERGLTRYFDGAFNDAKVVFESILAEAEDPTCQYYLDLCLKHLALAPEKNWSAINMIDG